MLVASVARGGSGHAQHVRPNTGPTRRGLTGQTMSDSSETLSGLWRPLYGVLRNSNSPDHGSNLQHVKHQAKTNLIKSVVTREPTKLLRRRSNCKLGNTE